MNLLLISKDKDSTRFASKHFGKCSKASNQESEQRCMRLKNNKQSRPFQETCLN